MKYPTIFEYVSSSDSLTLMPKEYPSTVLVPQDGYAVPSHDSVKIFASTHGFDAMIDDMRYVFAKHDGFCIIYHKGDDIICSRAEVFKSKDYAMGYAHGSGHNAMYHATSGIRLYRS